MIKPLIEKFHNLSEKEKRQYKVLIFLSLFASYCFYSAFLWEEMFFNQRMADRKADRIEKRLGEVKPPELEDGISEQVMKKLSKQEADLESSLLAFSGGILPLGDSAAREELKLSLTQLAFQNNLRLASLKTPELGTTLLLDDLHGEELRLYFQNRPTFTLVLTGQYLNLVGFIDSLTELRYQTYVEELDIESLSDETTLLKIQLELRI